MPELNLTRILRSNLVAQPDSVPATIESLGGDIGASDVVVYLVDFGQQFLEPLGNYSAHNELPKSEKVASTMAGRAFLTQEVVTARAARRDPHVDPDLRRLGPYGRAGTHAPQ